MIKKQLGVLAGSLLLAAGSQAAITTSAGLGSDSSVILVLAGTDNGAFVVETGINAGQLAAGQGFIADLTAASAALGGDISKWAILGVLGGTDAAAYNTGVGYFNGGNGLVYGSSAAAAGVSLINTVNTATAANSYISIVSAGGFFADGTTGDLDETGFGVTMFGIGAMNSVLTGSIFLQGTTTGFGATAFSAAVEITSPLSASSDVLLDGLTLSVTALEEPSAVPVPAAAWLFGSALLGMGVLRRKS